MKREIPHAPKGANVLAIGKSSKLDSPQLILILSYRIPIESWILECPGGTNDTDDIADCALRELKEETGYTGKLRSTTASYLTTYSDPWKSNDDNAIVIVDVDLDDKINEAPKQHLDSCEKIKVILFPIKGLKAEIVKMVKEKNIKVSSVVWSIVEGLELGQTLKYN